MSFAIYYFVKPGFSAIISLPTISSFCFQKRDPNEPYVGELRICKTIIILVLL